MQLTRPLSSDKSQKSPWKSRAGLVGVQVEEYARIVDRFLRAQMDHLAPLKDFLRRKSVVRGTVKLASGRMSDYYIDCKRTTLDPEGAVLTGQAILAVLKQNGLHPDAIGGPTIGADPIVAATAAMSFLAGRPLPAFLIRKDRKTHGLQKQIEGIELKRGLKVVIVDEVCTTGESTLDAIEAAEKEGLEIMAVLSLVDREEGGSEKIKLRKYPYFPVFTASQLLQHSGERSGADSKAAQRTEAPLADNRRST